MTEGSICLDTGDPEQMPLETCCGRCPATNCSKRSVCFGYPLANGKDNHATMMAGLGE